jgi:pimeloyl-ACP methyl ester carboxylesterase
VDATQQDDRPPASTTGQHRAFVLVPGAGGTAWYWHRVLPLLREAGHDAIAVDLPSADPAAGLSAYASVVAKTSAGYHDIVLVAQSMGGFTAPLAAELMPVRTLVLVNAMIPAPGETPGAWSGNTGSSQARTVAAEQGGYSPDFDMDAYFFHDVAPEIVAAGAPYQQPEADEIFESVCDFGAWPSVPIRVVAGREDRFFPAAFQQRVARERLGVEADVLPGGHLIALSQPAVLARYLLRA